MTTRVDGDAGPVLTPTEWSDPGGCSDADLDATEARLGVRFPAAFRAMMRAHAGADTEELERVFGPELGTAVGTDIEDFTCVNDGLIAADDLARVVPFCQAASGSYYALDFRAPGRVGVIDFDGGSTEMPTWDGFDEFIGDMIRDRA